MTFAANVQGHLLASHIFPIMPEVLDISEGFSALLTSNQALKACGLLVFHLLWMLIDSYMTLTEIKVIDSDYWVSVFFFFLVFPGPLGSAVPFSFFFAVQQPSWSSSLQEPLIFIPRVSFCPSLLHQWIYYRLVSRQQEVRENETGSPEVRRRSEPRGGAKELVLSGFYGSAPSEVFAGRTLIPFGLHASQSGGLCCGLCLFYQLLSSFLK